MLNSCDSCQSQCSIPGSVRKNEHYKQCSIGHRGYFRFYQVWPWPIEHVYSEEKCATVGRAFVEHRNTWKCTLEAFSPLGETAYLALKQTHVCSHVRTLQMRTCHLSCQEIWGKHFKLDFHVILHIMYMIFFYYKRRYVIKLDSIWQSPKSHKKFDMTLNTLYLIFLK